VGKRRIHVCGAETLRDGDAGSTQRCRCPQWCRCAVDGDLIQRSARVSLRQRQTLDLTHVMCKRCNSHRYSRQSADYKLGRGCARYQAGPPRISRRRSWNNPTVYGMWWASVVQHRRVVHQRQRMQCLGNEASALPPGRDVKYEFTHGPVSGLLWGGADLHK
jgi:hypothetical protein